MDRKMVRTQVYLPQKIYDQLKQRVDEEGLTMAHQIREALAQYVAESDAEDASKYVIADTDPIWHLIGIVESDVEDGSINHDAYLYRRDWDADSEAA
jgi:predicted DNA-binding protein